MIPALTFNEHFNAMLEIISAKQDECRAVVNDPDRPDSSDHGAAARDFAIAITHLEEAVTRYNSARYRMKGVWHRNDPDARLPGA